MSDRRDEKTVAMVGAIVRCIRKKQKLSALFKHKGRIQENYINGVVAK
jgi:hypothetical protein